MPTAPVPRGAGARRTVRSMPDRDVMLELGDASPIGRGGGRLCYAHPDDPGLCVKLPFNERGRKESRREYGYLRRVARRYGDGAVHAHVAPLYGAVPTDRGEGWLAGRVRDAPGGDASALLADALTPESFAAEPESWRAAYRELERWSRGGAVVVRDWSPTNLCVRRLADGRRRLVVIDGIGPKEALPLWLPSRRHARARNRYYSTRRGIESIESLLAACERHRRPAATA